jgi:hypothetical protein
MGSYLAHMRRRRDLMRSLAAAVLGAGVLAACGFSALASAHTPASPAQVRSVIEKELPTIKLTVSLQTPAGAAQFVRGQARVDRRRTA